MSVFDFIHQQRGGDAKRKLIHFGGVKTPKCFEMFHKLQKKSHFYLLMSKKSSTFVPKL